VAEAVLRIVALRAGYATGLPVVRDLSIDLHAGEIVVLLGPNGAGKSTVLQAISGTARVFGGQVLSGGADLAGRPAWQVARAGLASVPQLANVFAGMTVRENLDFGLRARCGRAGPDMAAVLNLFPDLAALGRRRAGTLSGGQRQMVAIGRALLSGPAALLLDEPSAGLAAGLVMQLFAALRALAGRVPVLLVEQNVRAALAVADRAVLMAQGRVVRVGRPAELLDDPVVEAAYLGRKPA